MEDKKMNRKMKYKTPEMKDIMAGEENTNEWVEMSTHPSESGVTIPDFEWDD